MSRVMRLVIPLGVVCLVVLGVVAFLLIRGSERRTGSPPADAAPQAKGEKSAGPPSPQNNPSGHRPAAGNALRAADDGEARPDTPADEDAHSEAEKTKLAALSTGSLEECGDLYADYLRRFPAAREGIEIRRCLASVYIRTERLDEARKLIQEAMAMTRSDPKEWTLCEIFLIDIETAAGNLDVAERMCYEIMTRPETGDVPDPSSVVYPCFVGPEKLATVEKARGNTAEADRILRLMGEKALEMAAANPEADYLPSYAAKAYSRRIELILTTQPENIEAAHALAEEMKQRLPDYRGLFDYDTVVRSLATHKQRLEAQKSAEGLDP